MVRAMWRRSGLRIALLSLTILTAPAAFVRAAWAQPSEGDEDASPDGESPDAEPDEESDDGEPSEEDLAAARALFKEGIALEKEGDWVTALGKFQAVSEVATTPQVLFHIALCEENLGRWVVAIQGFEEAAKLAAEVGEEAAKVAENAPARAEALRKKIPHLTLELQGHLVTSVVKLDGEPVERGALGSSIPVDVGTHIITVEKGGAETFREEITLEERDDETLKVVVKDADPDADDGPVLPPEPPEQEAPSRVPAVMVAGLGVVSLVAAGAFIGMRQAALGDVEDTCKDPDNLTGCAPSAEGRADDGKQAETLAFVFGGVGVASLATAAVLWFVVLAPDDDAAKSSGSARVQPRVEVGASPTGLLVRGQF